MTFAAFDGKNRRAKTALFLLLCFGAGVAPHLIDVSKELFPAIFLAIFLGGYGLNVVLSDRNKLFLSSTTFDEKLFDQLPSVDVLVAARDEENVIERLFVRLSNIRYPKDKITISIIDDGSKDRTPILLKDLIKKFPNFKVISRSSLLGGGKSGALNTALKKVHGEWIFILDADAQLQEDVLLRLIQFAVDGKWSAVQLRKSVVNSNQNSLACFQAMEMAMDAVIQRGRLISKGVVELRGNGQLLNRKVINQCGGFNEDTVTDDLDLSFRLLLLGASIGILWDPPIQEEAVESWTALFRQRQRWAEGGLQRFFDYWNLLFSSKLNYTKQVDLIAFFILQYALPLISFFDLFIALCTHSFPLYWPFSVVAFSISGLAFWSGCNRESEGPPLPKTKPLTLLMAIFYLLHWFIVIPWVSFKMAVFPKKLVWAKTIHQGNSPN